MKWLDVLAGGLALAWLGLAIYAYGLLAAHPLVPLRGEVPGMVEVDRAVLPLLAAVGGVGIIRYFGRRRTGRSSTDSGPDRASHLP